MIDDIKSQQMGKPRRANGPPSLPTLSTYQVRMAPASPGTVATTLPEPSRVKS